MPDKRLAPQLKDNWRILNTNFANSVIDDRSHRSN